MSKTATLVTLVVVWMGTAPSAAALGPSSFAEWMPKLNASADLEAGQVVGLFGESLSLSTAGADRVLVVATDPLTTGGDPGEAKRKEFASVALAGRARVQVRGPVRPGDLLFASGRNDGRAVALRVEAVTPRELRRFVGRALDASSGGTGLVDALVSAVDTEPFAALLAQRDTVLEAHEEEIEALTIRVVELEKLNATVAQLSQRLARLEQFEAERAGEELAPLPLPER